MKQLLQNLQNGSTEAVEVPVPACGHGRLLVATTRSLVSAGTERMLVDFGKAGWIEKARQQPEKVKQVLDKIRTDGLMPTLEAVRNKLDEPLPLGYCNVGVVLEIGEGLRARLRPAQPDIGVGDRVACNGPHAEVVSVPRNLCAKIPDGVADDEAAFTVLASIALQGVRLAAPTLGERFVVFGLGLVGLLIVQLLRASGCLVLAADVSPSRLRLAEGFGARTVDLSQGTDPVAAAMAWTGGNGVDGVLIAASAKGDEIVHQAAQACRKRGRIVLVGVVDLNLRRSDFYEKELTFQVSCSYGPGRYDERYEQGGQDYPFGFVRWTEQRNFEAVLEAMRAGQLRVKDLITHRLALVEAAGAYGRVLHDPAALGILIEYPGFRAFDGVGGGVVGGTLRQAQGDKEGGQGDREGAQRKTGTAALFTGHQKEAVPSLLPAVGLIGAGSYARSILLPALSRTKARLRLVADINGVAAAHAARKFGAERAVSDHRQVLDDPDVHAVFVLVGHHLHARFVCEALEAGKHVFVEKPLAIDAAQLEQVIQTYAKEGCHEELHERTLCHGEQNENKECHGEPVEPCLGNLQGNKECHGAPNELKECHGVQSENNKCHGKPNENKECHGEPVEPCLFRPLDKPMSGPVPSNATVMVGFNRRFSPHTVKMQQLLMGRTEPLTMTVTVNAGFIPPEHWTQDPERGGGRIIGEGCHFIDLLSCLADSPVVSVSAIMLGGNGAVREDKMSILLGFADGSVGTVHYFANGAKNYPKESVEVFSEGRVIRMENFRVTRGYGFKGFTTFRTWRQDKGHRAEIAAFVSQVASGGPPLIPFERIVNITKASFAAVESARTGRVVAVI